MGPRNSWRDSPRRTAPIQSRLTTLSYYPASAEAQHLGQLSGIEIRRGPGYRGASGGAILKDDSGEPTGILQDTGLKGAGVCTPKRP